MLNIKSKKNKVKSKDAFKIVISGAVQGVGFRPFIYRLARRMNICGWVSNTSNGVFIQAESDKDKIYDFISRIYEEKPPSALIESIQVDESEYAGFKEFEIKESSAGGAGKNVIILADIATCPDCLEELFNPKDRRYLYPFINCTQCGPRFTIIKDIPYDRKNTTMDEFSMCPRCGKEYSDPNTRRFHAQPDACWECGPKIVLSGQDVEYEGTDTIEKSAELLKQGYIIAVKSLGGYQLACNALDRNAVEKLRDRKKRINKPFALMAKGMPMIADYAQFNEHERDLLMSYKRPIILLRKKEGTNIADSAAPDNNYIGFMLPYTPLHYVLFKYLDMPLVMTSGNIIDEPIYYKDEEAFQKLKGIADYFLTHNRKINIRCDDSVTRVFISLDGKLNKEYIIRRARGYAPMPLDMEYSFKQPILALGGYLKNTFAYGKDNHLFISQHIGDLNNASAVCAFEKGIEHYRKIFDIEPEVIVSDMHPEYYSSKYAQDLAKERGKQLIQVQHHHAHIVSCMAENNIKEKVIGIALDGTGFGQDNCIWGGEVMISDLKEFQRAAHLEYVHQPGAEAAVKNPYQMAVSWLYHSYGENLYSLGIEFIDRIGRDRINNVIAMMNENLNSPLTSSMGRLFAAVSSLIGFCDKASFEAEAEMKLEQLQDEYCREAYKFELIKDKKNLIISVQGVIKQIVEDIKKAVPKERIAAKFHNGLVDILCKLAQRLRRRYNINKICLSGGVFQNIVLLTKLYDRLISKGFEVYIQGKVPANDGGICLGQAVIANEILNS